MARPTTRSSARQRRSQHPLQLARDQHHTDTELGFGAGLVATHLNGRPPSQGGIYMPKARVSTHRAADWSARQHRRPPGEARAYSGQQVAL
ncbi:hypothetical protein BZL30_7058 [Mycobacterium kansasii]|uniref:Uncharacterized protein n=1 Tax=Mycobacterium kansasii TaxID=1768 RepID=A0A1V3WNN9_MYCKA|nr:hypothetical protein BZL30_7058 [Mycobacterium kansasii]